MSTYSEWLDWKPSSRVIEKEEVTKLTEPGFGSFVGTPTGTTLITRPPLDPPGTATLDECIVAPETPDDDWDRDELELISRIEDDAVRDEVIALKNILGGTLKRMGHAGRFVSADQYQKGMLNGLFAKHRRSQAQQYAGLTLQEKEELARSAERPEKAELRASRYERRVMQRGWAKWCRLREVAPFVADKVQGRACR
jgi:hypothetical protein